MLFKIVFVLCLSLLGIRAFAFAAYEEWFWIIVFRDESVPIALKQRFAIKSPIALSAYALFSTSDAKDIAFIETAKKQLSVDVTRSLLKNLKGGVYVLNLCDPNNKIVSAARRILNSEGDCVAVFRELGDDEWGDDERLTLFNFLARSGYPFTDSMLLSLFESTEDKTFKRVVLPKNLPDSLVEKLLEDSDYWNTIASQGNAKQVELLFDRIGVLKLSMEPLFTYDLAENPNLTNEFVTGKILQMLPNNPEEIYWEVSYCRTPCVEIINEVLKHAKSARLCAELAKTQAVSEDIRIRLLGKASLSEFKRSHELNFSLNAQRELVRNLETCKILISSDDFNWSIFPEIEFDFECLKYSMIENKNCPANVVEKLMKSKWELDKLIAVAERNCDLPQFAIEILFNNLIQNDDISKIKVLTLQGKIPIRIQEKK